MSLEKLLVVQSMQIAALAIVVWLLSKTIARKNVHLSFALWLVVLAKCVTPPIWSSPVGVFSWLNVDATQTEFVSSPEVVDAESGLLEPFLSDRFSTFESEPIEFPTTAATGEASNAFPAINQLDMPPFEIEGSIANTEPPSIWQITSAWLPAAWLLIATLLMVGTVIRAWCYIRALAACSVEDATLQNRADGIRKRLGIKRNIQLLVTSSAVGPAVVGLLRPRIVVPEKLTQNFDGSDLDPILAHELLHIRRGDLWIGLIRHSVSMLWWFHPLVWKTSNALRLGAESCCDEEVISTLGISAKDYARSLLSVLELKRELKAIPVAPGVRPFDITANRLEKIMTCEKRGRSRTPIWCWAVAVLLAVVSLPGASLMWGDEATIEASPQIEHYLDSEEISTEPTSVADSAGPDVVDGHENESKRETSVVAFEELPLSLLKRSKTEETVLGPGDVLGVYIEGILGAENQLPPVNLPDAAGVAPSFGFPIPIRKDGTVPLPLIRPLKVTGLTLEQAEELIVEAYTVKEKVLVEGEQRIIITMIRPRHIEVIVFRQDLSAEKIRSESSFVLSIASNKADVITALAKTGGLPADSVEEIVIHRESRTIRIPLRYPVGKQPVIAKADVTLQDGDIVTLKPAATNVRVEEPADRFDSVLPNTNPKVSASTPATVGKVAQPGVVEKPEHRERLKLTLEDAISIAIQNGHKVKVLAIRPMASSQSRLHVKRDHSNSPPSSLKQNPDFSPLAHDATTTFVTADQTNIRFFVVKVIEAYWELYFHYRNLEAARTGFGAADAIWKQAKTRKEKELVGGEATDEAQSRAQYFAFKSRLEQAKSDLHHQESRLRHLLGMSNDGRLIQPIDQPSKARFEYDWDEINDESVNSSPELRRQRWRVKQNELQLLDAKKQLSPEIDADALWAQLTEGEFREWRTGFPQLRLGSRAKLTQVRGQQLQLKRSRKRLEQLELAQQLSSAVRRLRDRYRVAQTQFKALKAARDQVSAAETGYRVAQSVPLAVVLDAQSRQSQTEIDYFRTLTEYQIANSEVHYRKGSLLEHHGIKLDPKQQNADVESAVKQSFDLVPKESSAYGGLGL